MSKRRTAITQVDFEVFKDIKSGKIYTGLQLVACRDRTWGVDLILTGPGLPKCCKKRSAFEPDQYCRFDSKCVKRGNGWELVLSPQVR